MLALGGIFISETFIGKDGIMAIQGSPQFDIVNFNCYN